MTKSNYRTGISKFAGNVLDEARELADGILARTSDLEHDIRKALSKGIRPGHRASSPTTRT